MPILVLNGDDNPTFRNEGLLFEPKRFELFGDFLQVDGHHPFLRLLNARNEK